MTENFFSGFIPEAPELNSKQFFFNIYVRLSKKSIPQKEWVEISS